MGEPLQEEEERHLLRRFAAEAADVAGSPADLAALIRRATSHPSLFSFASFLSSPSLSQLDGSEHASSLDLLRLFAHGTWSDYKRKGIHLPTLVFGQILKMKQLTVLTLAAENKILFYDQLMLELDVLNERELEDFLIDECMYAGIVRGKLNHLDRLFEVQFSVARDVTSGQLNAMIQSLSNWLSVSDNLLVSIQDRIEWAVSMSEATNEHRKEIADKVEAVKMLLRGNGQKNYYSRIIVGSLSRTKFSAFQDI